MFSINQTRKVKEKGGKMQQYPSIMKRSSSYPYSK